MSDSSKTNTVVITGAGGMGLAMARRIGAGRLVILADYSEAILHSAAKQLEDDGHAVKTHKVDVSDIGPVKQLAADAAKLGRIEAVIHTAGLSPAMAPSKRVFEVDLLGAAIVIDEFADVIAPGGSLVCIASMAGHSVHGQLPAEAEEHLAKAPLESLLSHPMLNPDNATSMKAYALSKRGNQLRVQSAARKYGERGCRINSISPGVIYTPMTRMELDAGETVGESIGWLVKDSAAGRWGTSADIAAAAAFLISSEASFVTGTDLLVDGGSVANGSMKSMQGEENKETNH